MATSGSFTTTSADGKWIVFAWQRTAYSIANNTSTISWSLTGAGGSGYTMAGPIALTLNGSQVYSETGRIQLRNGTVLASGTATITHDQDGTKGFSASCNAAIYSGQINCSGSGTWALDAIPRASSIAADKSTVELGESVTFTITRASNSFTHNIQCRVDGVNGFDWWTLNGTTKVATSYTWTLPTAWAQYFPYGEKLRVRVQTYNGNTLIGTKEMTALNVTAPQSMAPTATLSVTDPTGNLTTYGGFVKAQSKIRAEVTETFYAGTGAASRALTVAGITYSATQAETPDVITSIPQTVTYRVTDGRGLTANVTENLTTYDWYAPQITAFTINRCLQDGTLDEEGAYCKVAFSYDIAPIGNQNSKTAVLSYTQARATQNIPLANYSGSIEVIIPANPDNSYTITLTLTDDFKTATASDVLGTAFTLVDYHASGTGIAFGKVAESGDIMDCDLYVRARQGITTGTAADSNEVELANFSADFVLKWKARV